MGIRDGVARQFLLGLLIGIFLALPAGAEERLLMARSPLAFPETMLNLQEAIGSHGYKVARVQRVDIGLTTAGFETDKYRIVFYGDTGEIQQLAATHPDLIPFLPPSFSIFAEGEQTLVTAANPMFLARHYPDLSTRFARWESDIRSILAEIRAGDED